MLGQGSFATVHSASCAGQPVALKSICLHADKLERASLELGILQLQLPGIVQFKGAYAERVHAQDGVSLLKVILDLHGGLVALSERRILHRDVKLANTFL